MSISFENFGKWFWVVLDSYIREECQDPNKRKAGQNVFHYLEEKHPEKIKEFYAWRTKRKIK